MRQILVNLGNGSWGWRLETQIEKVETCWERESFWIRIAASHILFINALLGRYSVAKFTTALGLSSKVKLLVVEITTYHNPG